MNDINERFTDRANRVVESAEREARERGHASVGIEHILLATVREGFGNAVAILTARGIGEDKLVTELERLEAVEDAGTELSTELKQGMARAVEEASHLGQKFVDSDLLLVGILQTPEATKPALGRLGLEGESLRRDILGQIQKARKNLRGQPAAARQTFSIKVSQERLSPQARKVMALARQEARQAGSPRVSTGHILLALAAEDGSTVNGILTQSGVESDRLRDVVGTLMSEKPDADMEERAVTRETREFLGLSTQEADDLGDEEVTTEHLFLGLLKHPGCTATRTLQELGLDLHYLSAQVDAALG